MTLSRRKFVQLGSAALAASAAPWTKVFAGAPMLPLPSASQLAWQRDELAVFIHFGVNTFTDREWGDGKEDPAIFNPTELDARQWARTARATGAKAMVLTAKHHDGFCLFPTQTTQHSVASSPWRGGHGDLVREYADACRAEGLRVGLYCSPWDRNSPLYGTPRYNDFYCAQLTELLTRYGAIHEMWFDGANGEGPDGRHQTYDWPRIHALVRKLQPQAVMFSDAGPDVRWCGNEKGLAGYPNWSTVNPAAVPYPGADSPAVTDALLHGDRAGGVWMPAEADVSIRPGWFNHAAEDSQVKSVETLTDIWFNSVGHNAKLLLNVPPARNGLIHATDVERLTQWRASLNRLFAVDLARGRLLQWRITGARAAVAEIDLGAVQDVGIARLDEQIAQGQRVARYRLEGALDGSWQELAQGSTIGYCKLDRFPRARVRKVRVTIEDAVAAPLSLRVALFGGESA